MSNSVIVQTVSGVDISIEAEKAAKLLILSAQMERGREIQGELRKEFIALLPEATPEQMKVIEVAAREDAEIPEGYRPNVDCRLTVAQLEQVDAAKKERAAYVSANKGALLAPLLSDATQELVALTVRAGKNRTTTTARFVKKVATSQESRSLLAQIAKATLAQAREEKKTD